MDAVTAFAARRLDVSDRRGCRAEISNGSNFYRRLSVKRVDFVTKRKKNLSKFLYHTKDHLAQFSEMKNEWWGRPT